MCAKILETWKLHDDDIIVPGWVQQVQLTQDVFWITIGGREKASVLRSVLPTQFSSIQYPCQILNLRNLTFLGDMESMNVFSQALKILVEL